MARRPIQFLQANLNHCAGAQDLLFQALVQWQIDVAIVAEPYYVPNRSNWVGDLSGLVAVCSSGDGLPLQTRERGQGFVAADWGGYTIFGVYFSPNKTLAEFEDFLGELQAAALRTAPRPVLVAGDFNAKHSA